MPEPPPTSHDPADAAPLLALGVAGDRVAAPVESAHGEDPMLSNPDEASPPERVTESTMIDIHPAHHAATTWRDFFIHIATIVLGLIIAVGLEQTVEYFHHRHQIAETREALRAERELNNNYPLDVGYAESQPWQGCREGRFGLPCFGLPRFGNHRWLWPMWKFRWNVRTGDV